MRAVVAVSLMFFLSGCASQWMAQHYYWKPINGAQPTNDQFQADRAICLSAASGAAWSLAPQPGTTVIVQNQPPSTGGINFIRQNPVQITPSPGANTEAGDSAMMGCMAQRGYILARKEAPQQ